ncbi:unnamed protein product [Ranitomeya imitator]|uniref:Uncharacterized protein n=1 Tax=Ranitomeya imitator TaxID=111125 RepID=A0ABN9KSR9_9NEOB|nr:unnamed protein product [Ranitomeya imitator]
MLQPCLSKNPVRVEEESEAHEIVYTPVEAEDEEGFFKVATFCFDDCFAHSWHSLDELQEAVIGNGFHYTAPPPHHITTHNPAPKHYHTRLRPPHYHTRLRSHTLPNKALSSHITIRGSVLTHYHTRRCPHTLPHKALSSHITTRGSVPTHYRTRLRPHTLPHEAPSPHITTRGSVLTHYHMRLHPHTLPHDAPLPHTLPHEAPSSHITTQGCILTHYHTRLHPTHYHTRLRPHTLPHEAPSTHITTLKDLHLFARKLVLKKLHLKKMSEDIKWTATAQEAIAIQNEL